MTSDGTGGRCGRLQSPLRHDTTALPAKARVFAPPPPRMRSVFLPPPLRPAQLPLGSWESCEERAAWRDAGFPQLHGPSRLLRRGAVCPALPDPTQRAVEAESVLQWAGLVWSHWVAVMRFSLCLRLLLHTGDVCGSCVLEGRGFFCVVGRALDVPLRATSPRDVSSGERRFVSRSINGKVHSCFLQRFAASPSLPSWVCTFVEEPAPGLFPLARSLGRGVGGAFTRVLRTGVWMGCNAICGAKPAPFPGYCGSGAPGYRSSRAFPTFSVEVPVPLQSLIRCVRRQCVGRVLQLRYCLPPATHAPSSRSRSVFASGTRHVGIVGGEVKPPHSGGLTDS